MGDPSGIGPEVLMKAMASPDIRGLAIFMVIGDEKVLRDLSAGCDAPPVRKLTPVKGDGLKEQLCPDVINLLDPGGGCDDLEPGVPSRSGAAMCLKSLETAVELMLHSGPHMPKALVTAPLSKDSIADIEPGFTGHTEYLQRAYGARRVTMALVSDQLKVVPLTRHIPLKDVPSGISEEGIRETIEQVLDNRILLCGKKDIRIGVCGLNPHNGENGRIGTEEIDIIEPAVRALRRAYPAVIGPVPADVIFHSAIRGDIDIVIGMYHDQCLSPFKMVAFDSGVNITLGLGHIRTSPDHGTAFDIAGKGIADPGSMINAVKTAVRGVTR